MVIVRGMLKYATISWLGDVLSAVDISDEGARYQKIDN